MYLRQTARRSNEALAGTGKMCAEMVLEVQGHEERANRDEDENRNDQYGELECSPDALEPDVASPVTSESAESQSNGGEI